MRTELPSTQLELELQAEVDKFVFLALDGDAKPRADTKSLHRLIFEDSIFLHPADTEAGERYRYANRLAARLAARLAGRDAAEARALLRRFYRAGQAEKIALARAA